MNKFARFTAATRSKALRFGAVAGASALALVSNAHAAGEEVDVAAVVAKILAQLTPIGLIGVAVLTVIASIMAFRWVRGAMR